MEVIPLDVDLSDTFCDAFMEHMYKMYQAEQFTDYELEVQHRVFKVHRVILASTSEYFLNIFPDGDVETEVKPTEIQGISERGMDLLIKYAYTGVLELTIENIGDVLEAANLLKTVYAMDICVTFIQDNMTFDNANKLMKIVEPYSITSLKEYHRNFHLKNFLKYVESKTFLTIDADTLVDFLSDDGLVTTSESILFHHCLRWLYNEFDKRIKVAHKVFNNVRMCLDGWPLVEVAKSHSIFRTCRRLKSIVQYFTQYLENSTKRYINNTSNKTRIRSPRNTMLQFGGFREHDPIDTELMNVPLHTHCGWNMNHYFHPDCHSWFPLGLVGNGAKRMSHQRFVEVNGCGVLVGGFEYYIQDNVVYRTCVKDVIMFHAQGHFELCSMPSLQHKRAQHAVVYLEGYIYAIAGSDDEQTLDTVERLDCLNETWSYVKPIPQKICDHAAVTCQGKIYVSGGTMLLYQDSIDLVWCYDPQTNNWIVKQNMLCARAGHGMVALNGCLYVAGGSSFGIGLTPDSVFCCLPDVEYYTINTNQWTMLSPMNTGIANFEMKVLEGKIIILGGVDSSHTILDDMYEYNEDLDQWNTFGKLKCPLKNTCCGIVAVKLTATNCMEDETDAYVEENKRWYNNITNIEL